MKKLLFLFSAICSVSLLWAAVGNTTTTSTYWKEADFNGTITPQQTSKVTTPDGFVSFEISGDKGVTYTASYHTVWASNKPRLSFGDLERHGYINGAITATPLQNGYTFVWTKLSTNTAACGAGGYFYLGHESETLLANAFGGTSSSSTKNFADYNDSVPFRFHRTGASIETSPAWMVRVDVEYQIFPNAPTWKDATDVMDVTVDNVNGQHYYNLANNIQVENPAFAGTVKYEIIGNNAQYVYWNGDHTAFYVLKPGTYTVKAYIEKVDGKYCSSAYTEELTINATTKEEDKAKAKIYFYMDGQMVEEIDPVNHIWNAVISIADKEEHYVEYVSGLTDLIFVTKSDRHLSYMDDTDLWGDHFMLKGTAGIDSVKVIQNGKNAWLAIKIDRMGSNHLPYTINSAEQFANQAIVIRAEKTQWDAEHNDIQFNGVDATEDIATTRTIEFAFTGIPDSVMFTYNTNARVNRGNVRLTLSYAVTPGNWVEVARVTASAGPEPQYDKACAYAIPANAKYVQLQYFNAQYDGWVHDFTITEKKAITFPQDTLVITGVHTPGGVATKTTSLSWYNVLDFLDWDKGMADADMFDVQSSKIPTALDQYKENIPYNVQYKLDEPGIHYANIMFWSQDKNEEGKFTTIAYYTVKGITSYAKKDLVIETPSLDEDTVVLEEGKTLKNPFVLKEREGKVLTDVQYEYEITPAGGVQIEADGTIEVQQKGCTRVVVKLKEDQIMPGGVTDTIWIYVPNADDHHCGDNLTWSFDASTGVLHISGYGDMYNYKQGAAPWTSFRDSICSLVIDNGCTSIGNYAFYGLSNKNLKTIDLPNSVKQIGQYAFANCKYLKNLYLGASLEEIYANAFANDERLIYITCYAIEPPLLDESAFVNYDAYLSVPCESQADYKVSKGWKLFNKENISCIGAEEKPIEEDSVIVDPQDNQATITWPQNDQAAGYSIEITKDGVVFCTLKFNAQGQLIGIAFAPSRDGARETAAATMTANGWQFTVTGLNQGSKYNYTLDVLNAQQQSIKQYTGEFITTGGIITNLYSLPNEGKDAHNSKFIIHNRLLIFRHGNFFNALGDRMK